MLMDPLKLSEAYAFVMSKDKKLDTFIRIIGGQSVVAKNKDWQ